MTFPAGRLLFLLACVLSAAVAREPGFGEFRAAHESLRTFRLNVGGQNAV